MPRIIIESSDGKKVESPAEDITTIGRRKKCNIVITDSAVSRHHATIELVDGAYVVRDEKSANGTTVNGDRITEHKLRDGDRITIGETVLTFVAGPPEPEPAPLPGPEEAPAAAAPRRPSPRRKSTRKPREETDIETAKSEAQRQEGVIKLILIGVSGVAFLIIVALIIRVATRRTSLGGPTAGTVHRNAEPGIDSLFNTGMKLMGETKYAEARDKFTRCRERCESLRKQPKYSGDGFYWLEKRMQDCNVKILACGNRLFRKEMRRKRGLD